MPNLPEPGSAEAVNLGEPTEPREAATVILLRDREEDGSLEVLLLRRSAESRFMPSVWVFPGGSLDPEDGEGMHGLAVCARRELQEESSIELDESARLIPLARWVTPEVVTRRFDTWFSLAEAPEGVEAGPDGNERTAATWIRPVDALAQYESGELAIVFPTLKQIEALALSATTAEALAKAEADPASTAPVLPKVIGDAENHRVVLPHEPDYPA